MILRRALIAVVFLFLSCFGAVAQLDSLKEKVIENLDTLRFAKVDFGSFKIAPYVAPIYSPETNFMISGGGLISFKVQKEDKKLNYSSIPFSFGYSIPGAIDVVVNHEVFWVMDRMRMIGEFQYKNRIDNYWGVGYDNGRDIEKSDTTTEYKRKYFKIKERVMFNLGHNLFIGPVVDFNITDASELNPIMQDDEYVKDQGTQFDPMGFGIAFEHDSRDFPSNAYKGWYLGGNIAYYSDWIKSPARYLRTEITYRHYIPIKRERRVLAWQVKSIMTTGSYIPWTDMPMIGGKDYLRGYTLGRFRDKELVSAVVEYRHMFKRKRLNKKGNYNSRWGYVAWVGTGSVAPRMIELKHWLPNGGVGLRWEVRDRMNIRVDAGIGQGEHGFYVTFKEAF
jgi:hypothetical protein